MYMTLWLHVNSMHRVCACNYESVKPPALNHTEYCEARIRKSTCCFKGEYMYCIPSPY